MKSQQKQPTTETGKQVPDRFFALWTFYTVIFLLPFLLFLWPWPFLSFTGYGFDFWNHHIQDQMELAFALQSGTFPLFMPGYFHGQTAFVLSEGQLFHPFFHFITRLPGYWQGEAANWSMLFHLLGMAGAHLALFAFLRRLKISAPLAFFLSLVTVYNLRLLLLSWFGSPMEAWSGHILLCAAVGCYYLKPTPVKGPLLILFAAYWLVTCGHPVWTYFGLLTVGLFALLLPFFVPVISGLSEGANASARLKFWALTLLFCLAGLSLAGGYIIPYYFDFVSTNSGIVDQSYAWAGTLAEPKGEFLNNFFLPLRTGYAMFAGTPLLLAAVLIPVLLFWRVRIPGIIWMILAVIWLIFLYMQGDTTPVHALAWRFFPLHHMIRGSARLAFALPMLFLLLLVWLFKCTPRVRFVRSGREKSLTALPVLGVSALGLLCIYVLFAPESVRLDLAPHARSNLSRLPAWIEPVIFITSAISLFLLVLYGMIEAARRRIVVWLLCGITVLHLILLFRFNPLYYSPLALKHQSFTRTAMAADKQVSMNMHMDHYYLNPGRGNKVVVEQLRNYFVEPQLGKIYRKYILAANKTDAYWILNQRRRADEVVLETNMELGLPQASPPLNDFRDRVVLQYSSYNRMVFSTTTVQPALFVFAPAYTGHWHARLNGKHAPVFRANGVSHAVRIPAGTSSIEFRYWSWAAAAGMGFGCISLAVIGCWFGLFRMRKPIGWLMAVSMVVLSGSVYLLWYGSLYTGNNLGTEYSWASPLPGTPQNIAYGKPTSMSSYKKGDLCFPLRYSSRHAVDGDSINKMTSSSHTDLEENPWWRVDLQSVNEIESIVIYLTPPYDILPFNQRPLRLFFSTDGDGWQSILVKEEGNNIKVRFQQPLKMRYIKVQASGRCVLSLMEVEAYPWSGAENR